jgi:sigma-54 dependent transcriptional regulator, acetoin dehydrogenase operon transcriptional activator AcoR
MESRGPGQTTVPVRHARGAQGSGIGAGSSLCWTFPRELVTELGGARVLLGRGEDCETTLPGRETSRHHAEIVRRGPLWVIRDLGSTNGTFVNAERVAEAPLASGEVVRLGEWVGIVVAADRAGGIEKLAEGLLGGPRLGQALEPGRRAAATDLAVIIQGETGTGKEQVARAIHSWSGRAGSFVAVNCAALPESLAEAELFGYRKGAFTGASRDAPGYFRAAHQGTLLLDEIVDLPAGVQAKLLRVIERGEVVPLGDTRPVPVDIRLLAAAQSSLREAVDRRQFRADLLARLEGVLIELPALRERKEDVPALFLHLLRRHAGGRPPRVDAKLIEGLVLHSWPYNVRELVQLVRRLLALHGTAELLTESHLSAVIAPSGVPRREAASEQAPPAATRAIAGGSAPARRARRTAELVERLETELERHAGNMTRAAAAVGISRQRAYRLLAREETPR